MTGGAVDWPWVEVEVWADAPPVMAMSATASVQR
jgi:hypothetical protein